MDRIRREGVVVAFGVVFGCSWDCSWDFEVKADDAVAVVVDDERGTGRRDDDTDSGAEALGMLLSLAALLELLAVTPEPDAVTGLSSAIFCCAYIHIHIHMEAGGWKNA